VTLANPAGGIEVGHHMRVHMQLGSEFAYVVNEQVCCGLTATSRSTSLSQFGMSKVPFKWLLATRMSVSAVL
jgi:hypothetical protein